LRIEIFILGFLISLAGCKVLELSDRFIDVSKQGLWLVKFYAPWCGHCKKLEPIWNQVAQSLHHSSIRVGRVDCTRFSAVATEFDIHGFPTILFLKGDKTYTYKGDRNREDIVDFALRLEGPPVQRIETAGDFEKAKNENDVFFLFVTKDLDDTTLLWKSFYEVAEKFQESNYFYSAHSDDIPQVNMDSSPQVYVFKDDRISSFKPALEGSAELNVTLAQWINRERFACFVKVTQGTLPMLLRTEKYLAIAVLEENLIGRFTTEMEEFQEMLKSVAHMHLEEFKEDFVFGWMPQPSLANSIAMQRLEAPSFLVVNSATYQYYLPTVDPADLNGESVVEFLRQIRKQTVRARGGNGILTRIYRIYYDATTTLAEMWYGNPVLTTVLFGLPLGFLSLIFYSICCADILDANEEDELAEDDLSHEKRE